MKINKKIWYSLTLAVSLLLSACGGGEKPNYTINAMVTGLATSESVVLLNNGGDPLIVTANAKLTSFATKATSYAVTIGTQPAGQFCVVTNGTGTATAAVSNVTVTCNSIVTGSVTGLPNAQKLTLLNNGGDAVSVTGGGGGTDSFTFPVAIADGGNYDVTVGVIAPGYLCNVSNGSGTVSGIVTNIVVSCTLQPYTITASVSANNFNSNIDSYSLKIGEGFTKALSISPVILRGTVGAATFSFQVPAGSSFTLGINRSGCNIFGSLPTGVTATLINNNSAFPAATATPTADISGIAFSCP